jgi:hypothetical protein
VTADIFDDLEAPANFDVVLCLAFFNHTMRFADLPSWDQSHGCPPCHRRLTWTFRSI